MKDFPQCAGEPNSAVGMTPLSQVNPIPNIKKTQWAELEPQNYR